MQLFKILIIGLVVSGCTLTDIREYSDKANSEINENKGNKLDSIYYHGVKKDENIYNIADLYGKSFLEIAEFNNLKPPYNLYNGQLLMVKDLSEDNIKKISLNKLDTIQVNESKIKQNDILLSSQNKTDFSSFH